ncbi:transposon Ty3-I Gag-Pol polyprotein [Trichonephila clavipes]|nr:transposon Ty3-I Gag-Pol polyprotein [Trichonephila clavipes]
MRCFLGIGQNPSSVIIVLQLDMLLDEVKALGKEVADLRRSRRSISAQNNVRRKRSNSFKPSKSAYASPLHMVPKKILLSGDQLRIIVHFNSQTIKENILYPALPTSLRNYMVIKTERNILVPMLTILLSNYNGTMQQLFPLRPQKKQSLKATLLKHPIPGAQLSFMEGRTFVIYTDQKPLTYAFQQQLEKCSPRQLRHLDFISQFSTDIRYTKGSDNTVADALSRIEIDEISPTVKKI